MKILRPALAILAATLVGLCCSPSRPRPADLLLRRGAVVTMDDDRSAATAVAVKAGRIAWVGGEREAERCIGPRTTVVDLEGKMVLPGFCDGHIHLAGGGLEMAGCDLAGLLDREEAFRRIAAWAAANPTPPWVTGGRWELPLFPGANPSRRDLDRLVPDRPACLDAADGHSVWVNSRALALAGIDRRTPDPPGGRIEREPDGAPSGCLREAAAELVSRLVPAPTAAERQRGLEKAQALANRHGITAVQEANADRELLDTYLALDRRGALTVRVHAAQSVDPAAGPAQVAELERRRAFYRGGRLAADAAKIFVDGVLETGTAALLAPYLGRGGDAGRPLIDDESLQRLAVALDRAGFRLHLHAIGDRAVRMALDAFAAARRANGIRDARHSITHLELVDEADRPRFRELGAGAVFQALWAQPDPYVTELTVPFVGPERAGGLYPIGSLLRAGATLVGASDWPVSSLAPLEAIEVAMTRRPPGRAEGPALNPGERVGLDEMLAAYTRNGAWLLGAGREWGAIEPGKAADLVVLECDLRSVPAAEIGRVPVAMTILEGKVVYRR